VDLLSYVGLNCGKRWCR